MSKNDDDVVNAMDRAMDVEMPAATPGFAPKGVGMPEPIPAATEESFVCLRGPCRYYLELVQFFGAGNPEGTPGVKNEGTIRMCLRPSGEPIDLVDELIYSCNQWDPSIDTARDQRQATWYTSNPEIANMVKRGSNGS